MVAPSKPPAATIEPIAISDATSLASIGLTPRQFRCWIAAEGIPHRRVGRRTVALVEDVRRALGATPAAAPAMSRVDLVRLAAGGGR
jgi:hypothetical protein